MKTTPTASSNWLSIGLLILIALFLVLSLWNLAATTHFGENDFVGYWSATYLLHNGENPYSVELMEAVQRQQVHSTLKATIMAWNPPVLFIFLLPLAWMSFQVAKFVWLFINLIIIVAAGVMVARLYLPVENSRLRLIFLIFVIGFPAVIAGLYMGQVTFLVFGGLVACLFLMKEKKWFWAGAALILTAIKPHIVILPAIYLLVYMAKSRRYKGWIGLVSAGLVCLIILLMFRSDLIYHLLGETTVAHVNWATPTIGGLLGHLGGPEIARYLIVLFLPLPFLLANYPQKITPELSVAVLTLITVPTTLFGWSYDQTMLLIPIAQIFSWVIRLKSRLPIIVAMACALVLNFCQRILVTNEVYYVWIPLFWGLVFMIIWYKISLLEKHV